MSALAVVDEVCERHPFACGALEGALAAGAAFFADAMLPAFGGVAWGTLLWGALAFGRSAARQATMAATMGLAADALSGGELGRSVAPFVAAMAAASFVRPTRVERWGLDHAAFAGIALAAWMAARALLALAMPSAFGPMPPLGGMLMSVPVLATVCTVFALVRVVRGVREPEQRIRAIRFGGRLA